MRSSSCLPLLLAASVAYALPEISITQHNHAQDDFAARRIRRDEGLAKRQGTVGTNLINVLGWEVGGAWYTNITVGTPPQPQTVLISTGTADLYVVAGDAYVCEEYEGCVGGTYNSNISSSYEIVAESPAFDASYGDGTNVTGPYGSDTVGIGDISLSNVQFGVGEDVEVTSSYALGIMGLGYNYNEFASVPYPNIPEVMVSAGVIASRLFSMFLASGDGVTGTVLFGGVDSSKYIQPMATIDLLPLPSSYTSDSDSTEIAAFIVPITGSGPNVNGEQYDFTIPDSDDYGDSTLPVLFAAGTPYLSVPTELWSTFSSVFTYVNEDQTVSCDYRYSNDSVALTFGDAITIKVPVSDFIVPYIDIYTDEALVDDDGDSICLFLILPDDSGDDEPYYTLGAPILRSMYVVYDLDNGQVGIAQAAANSTDAPNVIPVPAGPGGIASVAPGVQAASSSVAYTVDPPVNQTGSFSAAASTLASAIGTVTGTAAIPVSGQLQTSVETYDTSAYSTDDFYSSYYYGTSDYYGTTDNPLSTRTYTRVATTPHTFSTSSSSSSSTTSTTSSTSVATQTTSSGSAAQGRIVPGTDWATVYVAGFAMAMTALGFGIML